eukprot:TRINITY_DN491_c0_g1_i2.p4 TRINITY_DN491_c0_g1~~TRINITY_DN491_c0_g1_i2.p4  ORF type:complete len:156 (+),score=30.21 TRINITY_DN491_c0_g1_i2:54-521(+)
MGDRLTGEVVQWKASGGFGFIKCADYEKDLFVHHTAFGGGDLRVGSEVTFRVEDDSSGRKQCIEVEGDGVDKDAPRPPRRGGRGDSRDRRGGGYGGGRPRYDSRDRYESRGGGYGRDRYDSRDDRRGDRYDSRDRYDRRGDRYDSRDRYDRRGRY